MFNSKAKHILSSLPEVYQMPIMDNLAPYSGPRSGPHHCTGKWQKKKHTWSSNNILKTSSVIFKKFFKDFPIGLLKQNLWDEDSLFTRDKWPVSNVSIVWRFYVYLAWLLNKHSILCLVHKLHPLSTLCHVLDTIRPYTLIATTFGTVSVISAWNAQSSLPLTILLF